MDMQEAHRRAATAPARFGGGRIKKRDAPSIWELQESLCRGTPLEGTPMPTAPLPMADDVNMSWPRVRKQRTNERASLWEVSAALGAAQFQPQLPAPDDSETDAQIALLDALTAEVSAQAGLEQLEAGHVFEPQPALPALPAVSAELGHGHPLTSTVDDCGGLSLTDATDAAPAIDWHALAAQDDDEDDDGLNALGSDMTEALCGVFGSDELGALGSDELGAHGASRTGSPDLLAMQLGGLGHPELGGDGLLPPGFDPLAPRHVAAPPPDMPRAAPLPPVLATAVAASRAEPARHGAERKEWTAAEDEMIASAVAQYGCRWRKIAALLPGRSDDAVRNRWNRLKEPGSGGGAPSAEAARPAAAAAATAATVAAPPAFSSGGSSAELLASGGGVREKPPKGAPKPERAERPERVGWTKAEDAIILQSVGELGHKWYKIARQLPGRTDHAIRNRYHRLQNMMAEGHVQSAPTQPSAQPSVTPAIAVSRIVPQSISVPEPATGLLVSVPSPFPFGDTALPAALPSIPASPVLAL